MSRKHPPEAVDALAKELREEGTPELDWDRVERRLLERIDQEPPSLRTRWPWSKLALAAAAAAVVLVAVGAYLLKPTPAPLQTLVQPPRPALADLDGSKLQSGALVRADDTALRVNHPGKASWTLSPRSRARLLVAGQLLTVRLESGAVRVEVVKSGEPEAFAVEVRKTRIAVRGTVFRVELRGERVLVEVTEGTVAVGCTEPGKQTRSWLLTAPSRGAFSLDGARSGSIDGVKQTQPGDGMPSGSVDGFQQTEPKPADLQTEAAHGQPAPSAERPRAQEQPRDRLPETIPAAAANAGAAQVAQGIESCFVQHTEARGNVTVTVQSTVTLFVSPEGKLDTLRFDPPLAPAVQHCAVGLMQQVIFPASKQGASVTRVVQLTR